MVTAHGLMTFSCLLLAEVMFCHGFWYFSSSSSNTAKKMGGPPGPGYSVRSEAPYGAPWPNPPPPYQADANGHLTVALPVAVPFQPQMAPPPPALQGRLHDVQLVPCLCPVSTLMAKEYDPSQGQSQMAPQTSSGYTQMQQQPSSTANNP